MAQRITSIVDSMAEHAKCSPLAMQHCAVVLYRGMPVTWAYNNFSGLRTMHAEFAAIRKYMIDRGMLGLVKKQRFLWGCNQEQHFKECYRCINQEAVF